MLLLRAVAVVQLLLLCVLHMELVCCGKSSVRCREIERDILLELKEGFQNQSGRLASWVGNDCCAWQGVHCDNLTAHVTHLNLSISDDGYTNSHLVSLKQSLVGLEHLQSLDLSNNDFDSSPFPHFLDSFQELRYLNLKNCHFSGPIPERFGNISRLQYLDLSLNDIHESGGRWLHKLSRLRFIRVLQLHNCGLNFLPQTLPNSSFAFLAVLDLSGNNFNSTISRWPFTIPSLRHLDLSYCNLQGLLPVEIINLSKLLELDLSYNSIVITTNPERPRNFCNLRELYLIDLENQPGIDLKDLGDLWFHCARNSLEVLDISYSNLFGKIPDWLWELRNLTYLKLRGNSISGSIPAGIGKLTNLEQLDISDNKLNGTIDKSIGNLLKLEILDLSGNHLNGNLTEFHFSRLVCLSELLLSGNSLVLDVGSQWVPPSFQLQYIGMDGCQVGPLFPLWLQGQKNLTELSMSNSLIRDNLPEWFWSFSTNLQLVSLSNNQIIGKIPNLVSVTNNINISSREDYSSSNSSYSVEVSHTLQITILDLSNNSFFGPLPVDFAQAMPQLYQLDLSMNNFDGRIPSTLCDLPQLYLLDLSKNGLSGDIPSCWNKTLDLEYIDFGDNNISGGVPCSFCSANSVLWLLLYNNNISGEIPPCLKICTDLQELDIGNNRLVGSIPGWLGENLLYLTALILRRNLLVGRIPPQLSFLNQMNILDLSGNNLSGEIPKSFGNLTRMSYILNKYFYNSVIPTKAYVVFKGSPLYYENGYAEAIITMDLSSNMLSGEIPIELTELIGLQNLNFSNNHLGGEITSKIGKLRYLESLDLSRNQLDGPIPDSLSNLSFLSWLNLSYNMLSGRIPTGTQLQSQDPSAYIGNINLCGPPLTNSCEPKSEAPSNSYYDTNQGAEDSIWNLGSMGFGFAAGLLGFCGVILFQSKWSDSYLRFVDKLCDRFFLK